MKLTTDRIIKLVKYGNALEAELGSFQEKVEELVEYMKQLEDLKTYHARDMIHFLPGGTLIEFELQGYSPPVTEFKHAYTVFDRSKQDRMAQVMGVDGNYSVRTFDTDGTIKTYRNIKTKGAARTVAKQFVTEGKNAGRAKKAKRNKKPRS